MGSSKQFDLSPFDKCFAKKAGAAGRLSFADFMELALYAPKIGYYAREKKRIGQQQETDFYTSSSLGAVFPKAILSAATEALSPQSPTDYTLVEIGAEPNAGLFESDIAPFISSKTLQLGSSLHLPPKSVVISNELFDAQPFHRLIWKNGQWIEQGVTTTDSVFQWTHLENTSSELEPIISDLPDHPPEGYTIDLPLRAQQLLESIVQSDWKGLFIAFDYGKSWQELTSEFPVGTGRAYYHHQQSNDLLANPTEQDLTCHICWDWLSDTLKKHGFSSIELLSQEAFFIKKATHFISSVFKEHTDPLSKARTQLKQLLHPALMGQKFQVLVGQRH
jgi:SAM-dependent MidA family methyltransferase